MIMLPIALLSCTLSPSRRSSSLCELSTPGGRVSVLCRLLAVRIITSRDEPDSGASIQICVCVIFQRKCFQLEFVVFVKGAARPKPLEFHSIFEQSTPKMASHIPPGADPSTIPLAPSLNGSPPSFVNPENQSGTVFAVGLPFCIAAAALVSLRLATNFQFTRKFALDDCMLPSKD